MFLAGRYNFKIMKTIEEIRRDNLRILESQAGGRAELCQKLDKDQKYVSQLIGKTPSGNIGNKVAREVEEVFELESGWMDNVHTSEAAYRLAEPPSPAYSREISAEETETVMMIMGLVGDALNKFDEELGIEERIAFAKELFEMWKNRANPITLDNVSDLLEYKLRKEK